MAAVGVTISGVLYDKYGRTQQNVVLIGEASFTGLQVGGGPVYPPEQPPTIWGPPGPWPTPPIHLGPGGDIGGPPTIGGGPIIPPNPDPPDMVKPPPPEGGWAYTPQWGWGYYPGTSNPGPKK